MFITFSIAKIKMEDYVRHAIPFFVALIIALLFLTLGSAISL